MKSNWFRSPIIHSLHLKILLRWLLTFVFINEGLCLAWLIEVHILSMMDITCPSFFFTSPKKFILDHKSTPKTTREFATSLRITTSAHNTIFSTRQRTPLWGQIRKCGGTFSSFCWFPDPNRRHSFSDQNLHRKAGHWWRPNQADWCGYSRGSRSVQTLLGREENKTGDWDCQNLGKKSSTFATRLVDKKEIRLEHNRPDA